MLDFVHRLHWRLSRAREYPGIHQEIERLVNEAEMTSHEWKQRNIQLLRGVLMFAGEHVPFYRCVFRRIDFDPKHASLPDDLDRIPLLTKGVVRKHLGDLVADNVDKSDLLRNATGGSTGAPLSFYQDKPYWLLAGALDAHVCSWWGIKPHDRAASVWGADREFHELSWKERLYNWRYRLRSLNAFRMNERELDSFCQMLMKWRPPYLKGYSSALEALARFAASHGFNDLNFRAIRSSAEVLWPHQRDLIEETFNSPVYNFYGSREINNIAAECPEERRLHLISTRRYVEIVDNDGRKLPNGETGNIVITDLSNYAMPFIRYRNEDIGRLSPQPCACGRPSPVLEELLGRSTDLIRTHDSQIVHGEYFTHLFYGRNDIQRFQIIQKTLDRVIVRYVPLGQADEQFMNEVSRKIRERLGEKVAVTVEACSDIPIPPSGKHRFTISEINSWNRDEH